MVRKLLVAVTVSGSLILAGCNTIAGMGRDVQSVGKTVERTAD
jgi:entericidin B